MNKYETTIVLDAGIDQTVIDNEISNVERIVTTDGGRVLDIEKWGVRRFAYELKKRHQGNYIHIKFEGSGNIPDQLSKQFRINENILRHLTVVSRDVGGLAGALQRQKVQDDAVAESTEVIDLSIPDDIADPLPGESDDDSKEDKY